MVNVIKTISNHSPCGAELEIDLLFRIINAYTFYSRITNPPERVC